MGPLSGLSVVAHYVSPPYRIDRQTAHKPHVTHQNSRTNGTSFACQLAPKQFPSPRIVHPFKISHFKFGGPGKSPVQKFIHTSFTGVCMLTTIHFFCFKNGRNRCKLSGRKSALVSRLKTKFVLAPLGRTPWVISAIFLCECAPWPLTYIPSFVQICSGFVEL